MTYTLAPHVTAEMLEKEGFVENANGPDVPIVIDEEGQWCAVKVIKNVYVEINHIHYGDSWKTWIECSKKKDRKFYPTYLKPYIQDLISKGYVIENG